MELLKTFGDNLKIIRKRLGVTQYELAKRLGVSHAMIGQYERNLRNPKRSTIDRIANALGIDSKELMDFNVHPIDPVYALEALLSHCFGFSDQFYEPNHKGVYNPYWAVALDYDVNKEMDCYLFLYLEDMDFLISYMKSSLAPIIKQIASNRSLTDVRNRLASHDYDEE
ncbi:MAG: helix-turn-helix domain-containing protein [Defluviitaleaceae bacterium]|nr:helix-turn-helix domain-containing protein [Defluviitaleaceae bacterium]